MSKAAAPPVKGRPQKRRRTGYTDQRSHNSTGAAPPLPPPGGSTVAAWGLPEPITRGFARCGIAALYEWQDTCLRTIAGTHPLSSVIYSAPTSGGKSLVADLLLLRRLVYEGKRAMFVCPFVSLCRERANFLRTLLAGSGVVVEEFHGPVGRAWHSGVDIAVCTVQKAASIFHRILDGEEKLKFSDVIGTVVVDEFHLVNESGSSVMESFVTRLGLLPDRANLLLVGMSATLPDSTQRSVKTWLESHANGCLVYSCNFRPIDLRICIKRKESIFPIDNGGGGGGGAAAPRVLKPLTETDSDGFGALARESLSNSISTIIFCATRNWCENAVSMLAKLVGEPPHDDSRVEILEALRLLSPCRVHPILEQSILLGIAFHHAGMTSEERAVIEVGFRNRTILILCATSTLSAGVNLPAQRVVLRTITAASGGTPNPTAWAVSAKMKQMVGRAGRAGHAESGEAIIMCANDKEERLVRQVFAPGADAAPCQAPEAPSVSWVGKEILEIVIFLKFSTIAYFTNIFAHKKLVKDEKAVKGAIEFLLNGKLAALVAPDILVPTSIGDALAHSAMPPDEAEQVLRELNMARYKLCLAGGDIHLLFLVTPPVSVSESEFDEFVASSPVFAAREIRAILAEGDTPPRRKRMMVALMLRDLTRQDASIAQVAARYGVQVGTIQYLQSNAATYCAMVSAFCERLQWISLAAALNSIKPRLHFGVPDELLPLMEIEGVSPARARALARAGFGTCEKVGMASPLEIAVALTRDVNVEGTQMTSVHTAHRLLEVVSKLIINNARVLVGMTSVASSFPDQDDNVTGLWSPVSAPALIQQLIGTQWPSEPSATPPPQFVPSDEDEDAMFANALAALDAPPKRRRRVSEMTTIDARSLRRDMAEFALPSNNTAIDFVEEDGIVFDSVLLESFDAGA